MGLVFAGAWSADAQQPLSDPGLALGSRQLVTHFEPQTNGPTVLTVVEPQTHVVAVYHISRDSGEVKLKSVRNFHYDLQIEEYNSAAPTPREIRALLAPR